MSINLFFKSLGIACHSALGIKVLSEITNYPYKSNHGELKEFARLSRPESEETEDSCYGQDPKRKDIQQKQQSHV